MAYQSATADATDLRPCDQCEDLWMVCEALNMSVITTGELKKFYYITESTYGTTLLGPLPGARNAEREGRKQLPARLHLFVGDTFVPSERPGAVEGRI